MKTICIINQKGGVSKTTTTVNLAYYFQQKGLRVLAVDTNEQANLSGTFLKPSGAGSGLAAAKNESARSNDGAYPAASGSGPSNGSGHPADGSDSGQQMRGSSGRGSEYDASDAGYGESGISDTGSYSDVSGGGVNPDKTLFRFMTGTPVQVTRVYDRLDVIPSDDEITALDSWILSDPRAKLMPVSLMSKVLNQVRDNYDICLIDSPAQTGLITANSLAASDYVLIPVKTSEYSNDALDKTIDYVLEIKETINPDLQLLGIFLTFFDSRYNSSKNTLAVLQKSDLEEFLLESRIRQTQLIVNIEKQGSVFENHASSPVAQDYAALAEEILSKIFPKP